MGYLPIPLSFFFLSMQLKLRHIINKEILIYPGYVPEPGVSYRVLHYGLEFKVGNWSIDKANYRDVDMINKCWEKFPDPPDPSTLDQADEDIRQRDLLSIECAKTLNEALHLHHKRRNCPDPSTISTSNLNSGKDVTMSRKFGSFDEITASRTNQMPKNNSHESSKPAMIDGTFSSFRFWVVALWVFAGLGFLAVMFVVFSGPKRRGTRGKIYRHKRRSSYSGYSDMNGRDRQIRSADASL